MNNRLSAPGQARFKVMGLVGLSALIALGIVDRGVRGADEPVESSASTPASTEKPFTDEDRDHWAFRAAKVPTIPAVRNPTWGRNPIDQFVLARLEANQLSPAPEADRATLLRRVTFDLTGLPPTPEELDRFLADPSPRAFERVVDRLLASPHYGERWAQHWLDLARYADTDGFEFDQARPDAWRYRDWVVRSLNADLPYNEFVRRQLAGDEVDPDNPQSFIATGFNRCYPDMVDLNDQRLRRQNALNDITETTGLVFLGLTVGCARCHDHKFDPIRLSDFYRLQAFFSPARFRDDYPVVDSVERVTYERRVESWRGDLARVKTPLLELEVPVRKSLGVPLKPTVTDDVVTAYQKRSGQRSTQEIHLLFDYLEKDKRVKPGLFNLVLGPSHSILRDALRTRLKQVQAATPAPLPTARGIDLAAQPVSRTHLLRRGDFANQGAEVDPAVPSILASVSSPLRLSNANLRGVGLRTRLADWLLDVRNPLTSRVMVNRLWSRHFGRGIVATTSDFGMMGEEPSHPELLDWLALEFMAQGWSVKAMHRLILTSATYRQSSHPSSQGLKHDPENTLLWRHSRHRLDGEAIRDALLAVSDRLNPALGGPCVFPELPNELTKLSSHGAIWPVSEKEEDRLRRSLYIFVRRNLRYPFFEAFDRPDTNASCPQRSVTTIAPQALSLMNSKLALDAAQHFAERVRRESAETTAGQVQQAYRLALSRPPTGDEEQIAIQFLSSSPSQAEALRDFCLALLNVNEFIYLD